MPRVRRCWRLPDKTFVVVPAFILVMEGDGELEAVIFFQVPDHMRMLSSVSLFFMIPKVIDNPNFQIPVQFHTSFVGAEMTRGTN